MSTKISDKEHRQKIDKTIISLEVSNMHRRLSHQLVEKGFGTWLSRHEILGMLTEEYHETIEAVHAGDIEDVYQELMDMAVCCIFGMACIKQKTLDW